MNNVMLMPTAEAPKDGPEGPPGGYRVKDLCRRWLVGADKIHGFLRRGELVGVNVATSLCGRPQWRITPESVELFERRRSSAPPQKPERRKRRSDVINYFPDDPEELAALRQYEKRRISRDEYHQRVRAIRAARRAPAVP